MWHVTLFLITHYKSYVLISCSDLTPFVLRPLVCQNGATCTNSVGGFSCICVNGWTGPECSVNIDDCAGAACFNGATCIDRVGAFYCKCTPGKTGKIFLIHNWSNSSWSVFKSVGLVGDASTFDPKVGNSVVHKCNIVVSLRTILRLQGSRILVMSLFLFFSSTV